MNRFAQAALAVCLVCTCTFSCAQTSAKTSQGVIDARNWNFAESRLALNGLWKFYDSKLLSPGECVESSGTHALVPVIWNDVRSSGSGIGYATYSLKVIVQPSQHAWALDIPQLYNSYTLWVNDSIIAQNGKVGTTREESVPQWKPQVVKFSTQEDTLRFVIQIANFHHHKGGIREPIFFGDASVMTNYHSTAMVSVMSEVIFMVAEALFFIGFFLFGTKKKILLYFSFLCLSWALRGFFSNIYPVTHFFPDFDWTLMVRIEYLTLFFIMIFATLFISRLYREVGGMLFKYLMITINLLFIAFTLFTDSVIFTRWLELYLMAALAVMVYALVVIVRAFILNKSGTWFLMVSIVLGVVLVGYDIIAYEGVLINNLLIGSIGYIIIFACITAALLAHLGIIKNNTASATTLKYSDLYKTEEVEK